MITNLADNYSDVNLSERGNTQKNRQNVNLNVNRNVNLNRKKGLKSEYNQPQKTPGLSIEEPYISFTNDKQIIDGLLLAIKGLEASNSKHLEEIKQLKEQIIDLKREIPQIGTEMEGRNTMTA